MSIQMPPPPGVSGTFAALERTSPIVQVADDGVPTTTSMRVANGTHNEHASVLRLIRGNLADFEEFGRVGFEIAPFETAGGVQRREVAILNEEHATLLLTYMRNNDVVKDFKKRLVHAFAELRRAPAPTSFDLMRMMVDKLEEATRVADEAKALATKTEARIDAIEGRHDWYSALGYARVNGIQNTSTQFLNRVGRQASMIAKAHGIEAAKVPHQLFGEVNSYPAWVWELAFAGRGAA